MKIEKRDVRGALAATLALACTVAAAGVTWHPADD